MAVQKTSSGKVDKRTKEGKEIVARMARARAARAGAKKTQPTLKKTKSGKIDKRTKEGKEICTRMVKARKAKNSLKNRLKRLFQ